MEGFRMMITVAGRRMTYTLPPVALVNTSKRATTITSLAFLCRTTAGTHFRMFQLTSVNANDGANMVDVMVGGGGGGKSCKETTQRSMRWKDRTCFHNVFFWFLAIFCQFHRFFFLEYFFFRFLAKFKLDLMENLLSIFLEHLDFHSFSIHFRL